MTTAVQSLIDSFEQLSESERQEAVVELLRRLEPQGKLSEEALVHAAEELFRGLDTEESSDAEPGSR